MRRDYATLDAIVVVAALLIIGGGITGLMFFDVPSDNLPIVAGLLSGLTGTIIGGYAGFRWGASVKADAQDVNITNPPSDPVLTKDTER